MTRIRWYWTNNTGWFRPRITCLRSNIVRDCRARLLINVLLCRGLVELACQWHLTFKQRQVSGCASLSFVDSKFDALVIYGLSAHFRDKSVHRYFLLGVEVFDSVESWCRRDYLASEFIAWCIRLFVTVRSSVIVWWSSVRTSLDTDKFWRLLFAEAPRWRYRWVRWD